MTNKTPFAEWAETLTDEFEGPTKKSAAEKPLFPCTQCGGSGIWKGYMREGIWGEGKCRACKGRGGFKTSESDRNKSRASAKTSKAKRLEEAKDATIEAHGELIDDLRAIAHWHNFAGSLIESFDKYGGLTDKQMDAGYKSVARVKEKQAEREATKSSVSGDVDMARVLELFSTAKANGLKRPRFRTQHLDLSLAPDHGQNPGAIYVKYAGAYAGKIIDGKFRAGGSTPADTLDRLKAIAADPLKAATAYGQATGACGCCGRELTDPSSIDAGIGPICATKWGL